jgi:hypothetical protein
MISVLVFPLAALAVGHSSSSPNLEQGPSSEETAAD